MKKTHVNMKTIDLCDYTKIKLLHNFLGNSISELDLIAITETSHNDNDKFKSNIKLDGYDLFSTPTNSSKGGTAIFSKKN